MGLKDVIPLVGTLAQRPVASAAKDRLFLVEDTTDWFLSDGVSWVDADAVLGGTPAAALTPPDPAALGALWTADERDVVEVLRTRVNEIEALLVTRGLLTGA